MFLSQLTLDARSAAARRDLASAYEMHRTLSRAFTDSNDAPPSRFLWRLEKVSVDNAVLLVQSSEPGRWQRLAVNGDYPCHVASKPLDLAALLQDDKRYRFRLFANPTVTRGGKRYGLGSEDEQLDWLNRQLVKAGCVAQSVSRSRSERWSVRKKGHVITVQAAGFDGVLAVDNASLLCEAVEHGIGHAKALGLGLLSLAPWYG